jgi:hypothetical protein
MMLLITIAAVVIVTVLLLGASIWMREGRCLYLMPPPKAIPPAAWDRLRERTVFFGHQSVGYNIVEGLQDVAARRGSTGLRIIEIKNADQIEGPMLAHAQIGRNCNPQSKIDEFKAMMEDGVGEKVDIAMFKFCYVDMDVQSKPEAIYGAYCEVMDKLKTRFPKVTFVHVTVPLCGLPRTTKGRLKASLMQCIGRPTELDDNQVRTRYNTLLRERYAGKEPLFDLAFHETLGPDGLRHYSLCNGQEIPVLVETYTDDGGHLNETGRRHVAENMLSTLLELAGGLR